MPDGMSAEEIMVAAKAISRAFEIEDFLARNIVTVALEAARQCKIQGTPPKPFTKPAAKSSKDKKD